MSDDSVHFEMLMPDGWASRRERIWRGGDLDALCSCGHPWRAHDVATGECHGFRCGVKQ